MRRTLLAGLLAASLGFAAPHIAAAESDPEELIVESLQRILQAMSLVLQRFPRYAAPEVLDNGDIIIRRVSPPRDRGRSAPPTPDLEPAGSA